MSASWFPQRGGAADREGEPLNRGGTSATADARFWISASRSIPGRPSSPVNSVASTSMRAELFAPLRKAD